MGSSSNQHKHVEVTLEPIAARVQTHFVVIDSEPIPFCSPFARIASFAKGALVTLRRCVVAQWKTGLVVALGLIACEFLARSIEPRLMDRVYSKTLTSGHVIGMNSQGFRGEVLTLPKPSQTTRILALGDSVTFGTGVEASSTWPAQLQQLLSVTQGEVDVLNAGLEGLDLLQIQLEFVNRWQQFEPDYVVLMVSGYLVTTSYTRRGRSEVLPLDAWTREVISIKKDSSLKGKLRDVSRSSALLGALSIGMDHLKYFLGLKNHAVDASIPIGVMLAHGYQQNEIDDKAIDETWVRFESDLDTLLSTTSELGIPLIVVYAPPRFTLSESRSDNLKWVNKDRLKVDPFKRMIAICRERDIPFLDPRVPLSEASKPVYVLSDYTHFDHSGHKVIAELVAEYFRSSLAD
jgi:lysophospholipase L1-like esterase